MASRRADLPVSLAAVALCVGTAPLEHAGPADYVAGVVIGLALGLRSRHPRAAWLVTAATLLATAPFGPATTGVGLVVVAHAFSAGRGESRRWGIAGLVSLVAALEVNQLGTDAFVPALILPGAAWSAGGLCASASSWLTS